MVYRNKTNDSSLNLSELPKGIYFLELITEESKVIRRFI
ncbi:T9SS type A sorting domain-containing protein [Winogradskyella sp. UBA3174]